MAQPTVYLPESINVTGTVGVASRSPIRDLSGEFDDPRLQQQQAQQAQQADDTEWVRMCSDCRLIIDEGAPQFCEMTGLRHY